MSGPDRTDMFRGIMHNFMRDEGDARICVRCGNAESYDYHNKFPVAQVNRELFRETPHDFIANDTHPDMCNKCGLHGESKVHSKLKINMSSNVRTETIDEEAHRIVYGDREKTYGDPNKNFNKLALMWTGTLLDKLKPGVQLSANDIALCLVQLKVSRESFKPNRENRVDGIGYFLCLDRIVESNKDAK